MTDRVIADIGEQLQLAKAQGFSGAVLIVENGKRHLDKAYGDSKTPRIHPTSKFWIASVAKQFTNAAVLKCEEHGLLQLSDTLRKHVRDVPDDKQRITRMVKKII